VDEADAVVVGLGLELERLWPDQPGVVLAGAPRAEDDVAALVELLRAVLEGARRAVVVLPAFSGPDAWRRLQTAHALLDTDRVALHRTELPPLAAGVATALGAALVPHLPGPGALAGALGQIERELVVLAWLARVTGLRRPSPTVAQHARSVLPGGGGFLAILQPEPAVVGLTGTGADVPLARVDRPMELLMAPHPRGDVDWVVEVANPALGRLRLRELDPTEDGAAWWGTDRLVELVALPTELPALAARVAPALERCRWCTEPVAAGGPCPFCGDRAGAAAQQGGRT
jgi:hypothetical protein